MSDIYEKNEYESRFDKELSQYAAGELEASHVFDLGKPGDILKKCGFPEGQRIELAGARLKLKSQQGNHPFDILDVKGLDEALKNPVAVFEYGDKNKSQNVIVDLEKDGKKFLAGVFFNQKQGGYEVSSIRGLFNRDNIDWIRWIEQGKMLYGNKEKIQVPIAQQRTNLADVNNPDAGTSSDAYYLDSADNILNNFAGVNDIFTKNFPNYEKESKERYEVFKAFRNAYNAVDSIGADGAGRQAAEFYNALKENDEETINRYINSSELSQSAKKLKKRWETNESLTASANIASSALESDSIAQAAAALGAMSFTSDNYKELLDVLTKINNLNGNNIQLPPDEKTAPASAQGEEPRLETEPGKEKEKTVSLFDPEAPIIYGVTTLPAFSLLVNGKLEAFENCVVQGYDKEKRSYIISDGREQTALSRETFESIIKPKDSAEREKSEEIKKADGIGVVFADKERGIKGTETPEFALISQNGLKTYKGCTVQKYNAAEKSYELSNGDSSVVVPASTFKTLISAERFKKIFDENAKAYEKLPEQQYDDFFKQRDNTSYNFRHNLSVYCRKEANSPCDALKIAKEITNRMTAKEKAKTKKMLNQIKNKNETVNECIIRMYHDAVKEVPLNEEYIKNLRGDKNALGRPSFDIISEDGKNIANDPDLVRGGADYNLKIGQTLKNVDFPMSKAFGIGRENVHFDELKIVSASKENNAITLIDGNKSYFKLSRDDLLAFHKERTEKEMKEERTPQRKQSMAISYA